MNFKKLKSEKGITLIALIITIITLLILAGVSILTLTGDNGILTRTKSAKKTSEIAGIKEEIKTEIIAEQAGNEGNISESALKTILEKYGTINYDEDGKTIKSITTKKEGYEIAMSDIWDGTATKYMASEPNVSNIANKTYVTWAEKDGTYEINDTQTTKPSDWYDYENGKWANIKTAKDGLEAYWVWIPRFEYVVPTSTIATEIDVKFISKSKTTADSGYTIHPAFTWKKTENGKTMTKELDGIWVAKFEASSNTETPDTNYGGGDTTSLQVQIKPGTQSWRNISTKNMFTVCRDIQKTGVLAGSTNVDSHMMKNIEWGAVAILSQSKYGVYNPKSSTGLISNGGDGTLRVWNNPNGYNSGKYIYTGYAGDNADTSTYWAQPSEPTNMYFYNTINGTKASTTGTVYGVYDMAGGSSEYVAGCLRGQENSKFGVTAGDNTYVDLYTNKSGSYSDYSGAITGDATKETKGWNSDWSYFVNSSDPVFGRGGEFGEGGDLPGVFASYAFSGFPLNGGGFRVCLAF